MKDAINDASASGSLLFGMVRAFSAGYAIRSSTGHTRSSALCAMPEAGRGGADMTGSQITGNSVPAIGDRLGSPHGWSVDGMFIVVKSLDGNQLSYSGGIQSLDGSQQALYPDSGILTITGYRPL
jgi:hypothetical protein